MISIRFKDYLIDQQTFNRLAEQASADGIGSRLFEPLDEALTDSFTEYQALKNTYQQADDEKKLKINAEIKAIMEEYVKIPMKTIPREKLKWLKMPPRIWRIMTKHKVIGK